MAEFGRVIQDVFGRAALLEMATPLVRHAHPQRHLLFNLSSVATEFTVGSARLTLAEECGVAINGWEPHQYPHTQSEKHPLVLALYLNEAWLGASGLSGRFLSNYVAVRPSIARLCGHLRAELMWPEAGSGERVADMAASLVRLVGTACETSGSRLRPAVDSRVQTALHLLAGEPASHIDSHILARTCAVSRPHLFELFRAATGVSPLLYRNTLRMERALIDLVQTDLPIGKIALDLGFSEQANFARFFKLHQGLAPRSYRTAARPTIG